MALPRYSATVDSFDWETGIYATSFVNDPAIERNFVALSKAGRRLILAKDTVKHIVTGALLIPDQVIYRNDEYGEYEIVFSAAEIEKIAAKMMKQGMALYTTTHEHGNYIDGNHLAELWLVADPKRDKSVVLGLGEYPVGTLFVSYKINNATYWEEEVMTGNVKGFSLEGFFNFNTITTMSKQKATKKPATPPNKVSTFLKSLVAVLSSEEEADALADVAGADTADSGTPVLIFVLAEGGEVHVDSEGFATIDGEQAPAGEHTLDDGNVLVIDDAGQLVETTDEPAATEPAATEMRKAAIAAGKAYFKKKAAPAAPKTELEKVKAELAATKAKLAAKTAAQPKPTPGAAPAAATNKNARLAAAIQAQAKARKEANNG